jgi:hypothetical protein
MTEIFILQKMRAALHPTTHAVHYELNNQLPVNDLLGKLITLRHTLRIFCKNCGKRTKKSFAQGFCYPCFANAPQNAECILRPELCRAHLGQGRDVAWEQAHHHQPHLVYLAASSDLKVGVTRTTQMPTRWIDQGAAQAIVLAEVPYRQLAGAIEVYLKQYMTDKTSWQKMLKNELIDIDLTHEKNRVAQLLPAEYQPYISPHAEPTHLHYPVQKYPQKVASLKLDSTPEISGVLVGAKAQYLIFEGGKVFNVRAHEGYEVELHTP